MLRACFVCVSVCVTCVVCVCRDYALRCFDVCEEEGPFLNTKEAPPTLSYSVHSRVYRRATVRIDTRLYFTTQVGHRVGRAREPGCSRLDARHLETAVKRFSVFSEA